jgi:hypothetical protein
MTNAEKKDEEQSELLKKFVEVGTTVDPLQPKDLNDFDEHAIRHVANSDITEPAIYALLEPNYDLTHLGITKSLRDRAHQHIYIKSTSNLRTKIRQLRCNDINAYKMRFLREKNLTLENVEKFILLILKRKRS